MFSSTINNNIWFNASDLKIKKIIKVDDLHGYVLPHGGTTYTGNIISHTLRFRPSTVPTDVLILYYPADTKPDIENKYFHEFYVPWMSMSVIFKNKNIKFRGVNMRELNGKSELPLINANTLIVVSADFSHFMPFKTAIEKENKAARAILFNKFNDGHIVDVIDDVKTFKLLYNLMSNDWNLQWIGRSRSNGNNAVGYLTFLIRNSHVINTKNYSPAGAYVSPSENLAPDGTYIPDGIFVTVYDKYMTARECIGEWFFTKGNNWSRNKEQTLINKAMFLAKTTSRLTGGK